MEFLTELVTKTLLQVWQTLIVNWPFLVASAVIAAALKLYVDQDKIAAFLKRNRNSGVMIATITAVSTPLCSCGTTAIILGMMVGSMPWAPIVAFMVASPLTSPQELVFSAGLFGWPFALAFFISSILLGLFGGGLAQILETRGWLANQARFKSISGGSGLTFPAESSQAKPRVTWRTFVNESYLAGKRLAFFFLSFAFIGYLLNNLIPSQWISTLFGEGQVYGVPLAAVLGIPFYFNTEASLPLARALMESGMSQGAVLAFLITGSGTSIGAIAGLLTIARWRVVGLVIGTLTVGAIVFGYIYNILLSFGVL